MPPVNYHNHTSYCGHADGTIDEYIEAAIALGIKEMGFSDHAPLPEKLRPGITMHPGETEPYIEEILSAQERFSGRINIRLGFEVDYPLFGTFDEKYFTDSRIDYLIGSCHFLEDWPFDHSDYIDEFDRRDINAVYSHYFDILKGLASSGLFDIVGHFDLVKKFGHRPEKNIAENVRNTARVMSRNQIAVEINTSGLIKPVGEIYPSYDIIKILFEENVPVTMGSDSHSPAEVGQGFKEASVMLKKAGYTKVSGFSKRKRYDLPL